MLLKLVAGAAALLLTVSRIKTRNSTTAAKLYFVKLKLPCIISHTKFMGAKRVKELPGAIFKN